MDQRIQAIIDRWSLAEPVLMMVILEHEWVPNTAMSCPFRCGMGRIEYNHDLMGRLSDLQLEQYLKAEAIRIVLKHPYERQPDGCKRKSMALGSNMVLADNYDFSEINMPKPSDFNLKGSECYEWYSMQVEANGLAQDENEEAVIPDAGDAPSEEGGAEDDAPGEEDTAADKPDSIDGDDSGGQDVNLDDFCQLVTADGTVIYIMKESPQGDPDEPSDQGGSDGPGGPGDSDGSDVPREPSDPGQNKNAPSFPSEDLSSLWEEDSMMNAAIDSIIEDVQSSGSEYVWGSLAGAMAETIIANTKARVDYRKILSGFRASMLSSKRHLTRMRPNRRSGFENMGSIRRFDTCLLVAVDVSGSVSSAMLQHFYSIIGRLFKYGVEIVDVVQFDARLGEVQSLEKSKKRIEVLGRGGTSFQPIFDFVHEEKKYDGLIILTDGYAPEPKKPKRFKTPVVWVCTDEKSYEINKSWMKKTGRCCTIKL